MNAECKIQNAERDQPIVPSFASCILHFAFCMSPFAFQIPRCAATKTLRQKKGGGTKLPYADSGVSLKEAVRRSQLRFTLF